MEDDEIVETNVNEETDIVLPSPPTMSEIMEDLESCSKDDPVFYLARILDKVKDSRQSVGDFEKCLDLLKDQDNVTNNFVALENLLSSKPKSVNRKVSKVVAKYDKSSEQQAQQEEIDKKFQLFKTYSTHLNAANKLADALGPTVDFVEEETSKLALKLKGTDGSTNYEERCRERKNEAEENDSIKSSEQDLL